MATDRSDTYQKLLIVSLVAVTGLIGIFVYRELFPEYRIYQKAYEKLELFRSSYTGNAPPPFSSGVKQIVLASDDNGPETIDRCVSCHVALKLEHFSPTIPAVDVNGKVQLDDRGRPILVENPDYVWGRLDEKIASLRNEDVNAQLESQGLGGEVSKRLKEADELEGLKEVQVGHSHYDMTKVLQMHPLLGKETRPFELHPIEDVGCTACHGGNGRGLVTDRAHGPVFDSHYHAEAHAEMPHFLEEDPDNDPPFAQVFNAKPGHRLLFQTTPLLVGGLMEAKCVQCHQSVKGEFEGAVHTLQGVEARKERQIARIKEGIANDKQALAELASLQQAVERDGILATKERIEDKLGDYRLNDEERDVISGQVRYMDRFTDADKGAPELAQRQLLEEIRYDLAVILGSPETAQQFQAYLRNKGDFKSSVDGFLAQANVEESSAASIFGKMAAVADFEANKQRVVNVGESLAKVSENRDLLQSFSSDVDALTASYRRGRELFISQGCYACHRIAGYSRGGVGPELTLEGLSYPWFVKESIRWPQADLKTSTMPNFRLDHEEVEDLMSFLMAQRGEGKVISEMQYKISLAAWEAGAKLPIEQPLPASKIHDLRESMKIFALEGCASCHRLTGFESDVGLTAEKDGGSWDEVYEARQRFRKLFPEEIAGSAIVAAIDANHEELQKLISSDVRQGSIIEEIEAEEPDGLEAFYSPFKFALRAKNKSFDDRIKANPSQKGTILAEKDRYVETVHNVLKLYIQEYGFGRLIAPRLNWSGIYRDDEWLIAHFRNPAGHSPKSIMPVMPFDDTKFYALTNMLNVLGQRNRDAVREIWEHRGFNPELAYEIHCANCHGEHLHGNGPTAEWIYPIPKNLRNAHFLRNLTVARAVQSVQHGVKGTPMPPWGEVAPHKDFAENTPVLTEPEIAEIVDWLFRALPGSRVLSNEADVPKWNYTPEDVLKELRESGEELKGSDGEDEGSPLSSIDPGIRALMGYLEPSQDINEYYVDRFPKVRLGGEGLKDDDLTVDEVFEIVPGDGVEPHQYYIKESYYTPANILAGQELFLLHCSVCHGKEGAGNGNRSETMVEAKPRMLTNLDWLHTRDDLRLIRSIKYGVLGTAMTPWGDYTSALQRLQLVMFIRTLSQEKAQQEALQTALFETFERPVLLIAKERGARYKELERLQNEYDASRDARLSQYEKAQRSGGNTDTALQAYQQELQLLASVKSHEAVDSLLQELIESIQQEQEIYQRVGINLIERGASKQIISRFNELVTAEGERYTMQNDLLAMNSNAASQRNVEAMTSEITRYLEDQIQRLQEEKQRVEGQLPSGERSAKLEEIGQKIHSFEILRQRFVSGIKDAQLKQVRQRELFDMYQKQLRELSQLLEAVRGRLKAVA